MTGKVAQDAVARIKETLVNRAVSLVAPQFEKELEEQGFRPREFVSAVLDHLLMDGGGGAPPAGVGGEAPWGFRSDPMTTLLASAEELARRSDNAWEIIKELCHVVTLCLPEGEGVSVEPEGGPWRKSLHELQLRLCEACLEGQLKRHLNLVERLREIERFPDTIASTLDPGTLTKVGLGRLKQILEVERALYMEVGTRGRLIPVMGDMSGDEQPLELDELMADKLISRGEPVYLDPRKDRGTLGGRWGDAPAMFLPLVARGRTTGVVVLVGGRDSRWIGPVELELAERFANRLGVALENARLHSREQRKIKETVSLLELTRTINSTLDLEEVLDKVARMTVDLCGVVMCVAYLVEGDRLYPRAWAGFLEDGLWEEERRRGFSLQELERREAEDLLAGHPVTISHHRASFAAPTEILYEHGVVEVHLIPLNSRERLTGVLALFYPLRGGRGPDEEQRELVSAVAAQASMAVENACLYEDIERSYFSTVQALAKAIEVKDPYTRGHSERVTAYALMIAEAMGLDEVERQKLKYAATLHDIGKIGIAGRVLNKPGALTEEEYSHVKTHPALGDSIIEPVEFLQAPRPIILHHHERYDGKGYPAGLKGEEIPLAARILSVADAFEAMRSDRPYRRALPLEEARKELLRNSGTQFDPAVVEKFLEILERYGGDPVNR